MIIGIGIDIVDQQRIRADIERFGTAFVQRLFTQQEIVICQDAEQYAGKFTVKEAFMKAISAGLRQGIHFKDIEVLNHHSGAPYIVTYGIAADIIRQLSITAIHVTLSHAANLAVAVVILEKS